MILCFSVDYIEPSSFDIFSPFLDKRLTADGHGFSFSEISTVVIPSLRWSQKHDSALA